MVDDPVQANQRRVADREGIVFEPVGHVRFSIRCGEAQNYSMEFIN
jgi:hypothetical protein